MNTVDLYSYYNEIIAGIEENIPNINSTYIRTEFNKLKEENNVKESNKQILYYICLKRMLDLLNREGLITQDIKKTNLVISIAEENFKQMFKLYVDGYTSFEDFYHFMNMYIFNGIDEVKNKEKNRF